MMDDGTVVLWCFVMFVVLVVDGGFAMELKGKQLGLPLRPKL